MDNTVMLHNIERLPAPLSRRVIGSPLPVPFQSTLYGCHKARVKVITFFSPFVSSCARKSAVHALTMHPLTQARGQVTASDACAKKQGIAQAY